MGVIGRLLGKEPPKVPAGGRAYVSMDDGIGQMWSVRVEMPGVPMSIKDKHIGPIFHKQAIAYNYLDWITRAKPTFEYPEGEA